MAQGSWTGALLVGGASRRMGEDKLLLRLADGSKVIDRPAAALRSCCQNLWAAGAHGVDDPRRPDGFLAVADPTSVRPGPAVVLAALLELLEDDWLLMVAGDLPLLRGNHLQTLQTCAEADPRTPAVAISRRGPEPLVAAWPGTARGQVAAAIEHGVTSMHGLLDRIRWRPCGPFHSSGTATMIDPFYNLNRPEDWQQLRDRFRNGFDCE